MKVTAAHEFFHAIQFGYPLGDGWDWWMEASATFMEDEAFDAVNDYRQYLRPWLSSPEVPLDDEAVDDPPIRQRVVLQVPRRAVWRSRSHPFRAATSGRVPGGDDGHRQGPATAQTEACLGREARRVQPGVCRRQPAQS